MANFTLNQTGQTDIMTTFRFQIDITQSATELGLSVDDPLVGYIQRCDLPAAPGDPIVWHLPGGMKNYQAGKRTTRAIQVEFVVPSASSNGSIYKVLQKWADATYKLNDGTNIGKAKYCTDGITIKCKAEDDKVKYQFQLIRAQVTDVSYGTLSSESNDLLRVSATFVYDNYKVKDGDGVELRGS